MTNQKGLFGKMPFPSCKLSKMYLNAASTKDTLMSYFDVATESSSGKCHTHRSDEKVKAVSPHFILTHKSKFLKKRRHFDNVLCLHFLWFPVELCYVRNCKSLKTNLSLSGNNRKAPLLISADCLLQPALAHC